jgi:hypothetical protein
LGQKGEALAREGHAKSLSDCLQQLLAIISSYAEIALESNAWLDAFIKTQLALRAVGLCQLLECQLFHRHFRPPQLGSQPRS